MDLDSTAKLEAAPVGSGNYIRQNWPKMNLDDRRSFLIAEGICEGPWPPPNPPSPRRRQQETEEEGLDDEHIDLSFGGGISSVGAYRYSGNSSSTH